MRQCKWMEYLEDYDFTLHYQPSKANVVADELSRKSRRVLASWLPESGKRLRSWDNSGYTTRVKHFGEFSGYAFPHRQSDRAIGQNIAILSRPFTHMVVFK